MSAAFGLAPRQQSSRRKERLLGISKRGDVYLRSLLIHGARAVIRTAKDTRTTDSDHGPADHLLRGVDHFLDLSELRQHLGGYYSNTGRPSIDPASMIRMGLVAMVVIVLLLMGRL